MNFFNFIILFGFHLTVFLLKTPSVYAKFIGPQPRLPGQITDEVGPREQLLKLGADQCSATYCTTGTNRSTPSQHCCVECSCNADCWFYGNCCPDVTHPKPTQSLPTCTAHYIQNGKYFLRIEPLRAPSSECSPHCYQFEMKYYVIDSCLPFLTVTNQDNNYKCARNYSREESFLLDDIVFVHDNKTRTIYRNKYCAMCNNVKNTTRWRLSVTECSHALLSLPVDNYERAQHLVTECLLQIIPPDDLTAYDFAVCERYDSDSCPQTITSIAGDFLITNSLKTNEDMRQACSFSEFPAIGALATYRNIFCLMCNEGIQNPPPVDLKCDESFAKFLFKREISVIYIDYRNDLRNETSVCELEEIFDHVENVCRPLICPVTQAAVNGKCIANEQLLTQTAFKIMLQLYPINKVVFKQGGFIDPKSTLNQISRDISIDETSCQLIRGNIEIYSVQDSPYIDRIYFALYYYWTETCTSYYMASKISHLYESSYKQIIALLLNFTLEDFYFTLKFPPNWKSYLYYIGDENGNVNDDDAIYFRIEYGDFRNYSYFLFKTLDRCPLILLNDSGYCDVVKRLVVNRLVNETELGPACKDTFVSVTNVFNKEDINGTAMISICVNDYFKLFRKKHGIVSLSVQLLPCKVWLFVLVCIFAMCVQKHHVQYGCLYWCLYL